MVDLFLRYGVHINKPHKKSLTTPLHLACQSGSVEVVKKLLSNGGIESMSFQDKNGCIPFHLACQNGNVEVIKLLIENNNNPYFDIHSVDSNGWMGIHYATRFGHVELITFLLSHTQNEIINKQTLKTNKTPLMISIEFQQIEVSKLLISKQANPHIMDHTFNSPLNIASKLGLHDIVDLLLNVAFHIDLKSLQDRKSTRLNSSHSGESRMPSSA